METKGRGKGGQDEAAEVEAAQESALDAATQRLVERLVGKINGLVEEAEGRYDKIADLVFAEAYGSAFDAALDPARAPPPTVMALLDLAGGELKLSRTQLFHAARVGALNRKLDGRGWSELSWSFKVELLPLLGEGGDLDRLKVGVKEAQRPDATARSIRRWVETTTVGRTVLKGQTTKATFPAGAKAIRTGLGLSTVAARQPLVGRFLKMTDDERTTMLSQLRAAIRNYEKLAEEFDRALRDQ
jgi:hypothetical protein